MNRYDTLVFIVGRGTVNGLVGMVEARYRIKAVARHRE